MSSNLVVGILKQEDLPLIEMLHILFALHKLELETSKPSIEVMLNAAKPAPW